MRRILLALLIIYAPAAWAQIGPSNYPAATVPLNGVDAVLLDQGSGCATHVAPCTTSQAASTRIGQPVQRTTAPTSPFQYQQWIDTSLSPPKLKEFIGSTWFVIANLDPTAGFSFTIPSTSVTGLGTMATQNAVAVAITGGTITGMPTPTNGGDVASKSYVDSVATALVPQTAVKYATAAILPNTPTYSNGASGVGATLTAGSNTTLTVDGNVAGINDRVLVKNQAAQIQNGCYAISQVGSGAAPWVLTRCIDWDQSAEMKQNSYFFTSSGSVNAATSWFLANGGITVGASAIVFQQFSASNVYSASTGLTLGGSAFSITATGVAATSYGTATQVPTITVNAQGQITTASNTSISIPTTQITSGLLSLARGGTAADLTATGGTSQVLRQSSAGAAITVGQIGASDLSNGTFSGNVSALSGTVSALNFQIGSSATTDAGAAGFLNLANGPSWQFYGSASIGAGLAQLITGGSVRMVINSAGTVTLGAYGAGVLSTDGSGNVSATATTGTGAVMLAVSPTSTGTLTAATLSATTLNLGGRLFANTSGVFNALYDGAGNGGLYLGSGADPTNYYRNTAHVFGNIGGGVIYATLNSGGMNLTGALGVSNSLNVTNGIVGGTVTGTTSITTALYKINGANFATSDGTRRILYDESARDDIYLGGVGDPNNLYRNGAHYFQNVGGSINYFTITNTRITSTVDAYKPGGGSWADSSDERLKTNLVTGFDAMAKLRLLKPTLFDWKNPSAHGEAVGLAGDPAHGGFLAEEFKRVFPEFVRENDCETADCATVGGGKVYSITLPFKFDAYMIRALQQLDARLKAGGL